MKKQEIKINEFLDEFREFMKKYNETMELVKKYPLKPSSEEPKENPSIPFGSPYKKFFNPSNIAYSA